MVFSQLQATAAAAAVAQQPLMMLRGASAGLPVVVGAGVEGYGGAQGLWSLVRACALGGPQTQGGGRDKRCCVMCGTAKG